MCDIDDADPAFPGLPDKAEQLLGFTVRQRCGRFVEYENGQLRPERFRDFDHLLLGPGEIRDALPRPEPEPEFAEHLVRPPAGSGAVEYTERAFLRAEKQIFFDGELRD